LLKFTQVNELKVAEAEINKLPALLPPALRAQALDQAGLRP